MGIQMFVIYYAGKKELIKDLKMGMTPRQIYKCMENLQIAHMELLERGSILHGRIIGPVIVLKLTFQWESASN